MQRRVAFAICAAALAFGSFATIQHVSAQPPARQQIRLIVPFPAGGPTDIVARPFAQMLGEVLNSTVVIDNRGGAGGSLGADAVAKSAPDGRALLMGTVGTHAINPTLYNKLPYDPVRDFTPIALIAMAPVAVVVHPSLRANSLAELVTLARRTPGKLNYGSAGVGTPGHLTGEMFKSAAGIDIQHVPYRGSAPAVTDLIGGQLQIMFDPLQSVFSNIQGGRFRALAGSSKERSLIAPNVPTISESGFGGFETTAWWGLFAPAKLPTHLAETLIAAAGKIVQAAPFRNTLEPLGVVPTLISGQAFAQFQASEMIKWGKAVRDSGATPE